MPKIKALSLIVCLFLCQSISAIAQENRHDDIISGYILDLTKIWKEYNTYTFDHMLLDSNVKGTTNLFSVAEAFNLKRKELLIKKNQLQRKIYTKDIGLQFSGAYQENFSAPFVDPEDVVVFRRKVQLGFDWDILKNGFYYHRLKAKIISNEIKMLERKSFLNNLTKFQLQNTQQITYFFNQKKLDVLRKREAMIKEQREVAEKLYALKHLTRDDYLKTIQHHTDINGQKGIYNDFNTASKDYTYPNDFDFPVLDIDIAALLKCAGEVVPDSSYLLQAENAKIQNNFLNEISLRTSLKYNYYDVYTQSIPNRSFISFHLNFAVPIFFNFKEKNELIATETEILKEANQGDNNEIQFILLNHFYEYRYKLKQYYNQYLKRDIFGELVRTERVKQELGDIEFNPNTALFILDDYWANAIELLDLRQELYKVLLAIKMKVPRANISEYTRAARMSDYVDIKKKPFRGVYIWSDAFKNYENDVLTEYCKLNEFNQLFLSYNNDKQYQQRMKAFIDKNYTSDIHLTIGQNKFINGGLGSYLDSMKTKVELRFIKGVHLDIEPHTQSDFKDNKEKYFESYKAVLQEAKAFCMANKLQLSVAIPLFYPENILSEIYKVCDFTVLMAYENIEPEFINRKVSEELSFGEEKNVLAFRTKDFENREKMDAHFKRFKFSKIAYHDLDDLRKFDDKSINVKEK
jgi:hypothetical protein